MGSSRSDANIRQANQGGFADRMQPFADRPGADAPDIGDGPKPPALARARCATSGL